MIWNFLKCWFLLAFICLFFFTLYPFIAREMIESTGEVMSAIVLSIVALIVSCYIAFEITTDNRKAQESLEREMQENEEFLKGDSQ